MARNRLKKIWKDGGAALNGWLSIGNSFSAEIMAAQGYDALTVDIQHGALDYSAALPMLQAMRASGVVPMARVPWREPGIIMKALDAGALGIICPMVNNAREAAEFVSYLRYPPAGTRSWGPTRATFAHGGYGIDMNDEVMGFAMIETAEAMKNLEEIVATPGLDGVYIGPSDLTIGTQGGRLPPGFDREEPEMIDLIQRVLDAARGQGLHAGLHCGSPEYAARAVEWGFNLVTVGGDSRFLADGAGASVRHFRELTSGSPSKAQKANY